MGDLMSPCPRFISSFICCWTVTCRHPSIPMVVVNGPCCLKKSPKDVIVICGSTNFESNRFEFKSSAWCGAFFKLLHLVREHPLLML